MLLEEIPIYVVNLKERPELTIALKSKLESFGVLDKTFFLDAIRFDLLDKDKTIFWDNMYSDRYRYKNYLLTVGCLSSHYSIWEKIRDSENDYALVFEEDVKFEDNFVDEFNKIEIPDDFDILFLGGNFLQLKDINAPVKEIATIDNGIYIPDFHNKDCFTTEAYILSKKGANKLINNIDTENSFFEDNLMRYKIKSINPIDWYMHNMAKKGLLSYYALNPLICYQSQFRQIIGNE